MNAPRPPATPTDAAGETMESFVNDCLSSDHATFAEKVERLRSFVAASIAKERADSKRLDALELLGSISLEEDRRFVCTLVSDGWHEANFLPTWRTVLDAAMAKKGAGA